MEQLNRLRIERFGVKTHAPEMVGGKLVYSRLCNGNFVVGLPGYDPFLFGIASTSRLSQYLVYKKQQ